ncbi:TNF receptor-associated factor 6-like [Dysidea avara]|uniref:TNF receptor-associated factor 6-like n=1 Tax=Dysidea avara TaxID=196820 RepID=UPI00331CF8D9
MNSLYLLHEFITQQLDRALPVIVSLQNYSAKLEESSKPGGTSFRTVRFYSHRGYKMYHNINPSSQGTRKDRYLAVFVNITAGENDDKLEWPYDGRVQVKLLNQLYDEGHFMYKKEYYLSRNNPDIKLHCIVKPAGGRSNPGWGYTDFIMSECLKKQEEAPLVQYLVNDKLFFEIDAD